MPPTAFAGQPVYRLIYLLQFVGRSQPHVKKLYHFDSVKNLEPTRGLLYFVSCSAYGKATTQGLHFTPIGSIGNGVNGQYIQSLKLSSICKSSCICSSSSMPLAEHHGSLRLVQAMSSWSVTTRYNLSLYWRYSTSW